MSAFLGDPASAALVLPKSAPGRETGPRSKPDLRVGGSGNDGQATVLVPWGGYARGSTSLGSAYRTMCAGGALPAAIDHPEG